jgi:two-component system, NtrC family, sensor histidine kinase PilS
MRFRPTLARLPEPRSILTWVYSIRIGVSALLFGSLWAWQPTAHAVTIGAALILLAAGAVTAISFWHTHIAGRTPGRNFLYGQAVFDTAIVAWTVHHTGGASSVFAPLFILVIWAAAILLPRVGGFLIAMFASVLYVASVVVTADTAVDGGVVLQLLLFTAVAVLTGYLGDRLRQTGRALGEAEAKLDMLRLDTAEILDTINTGILTVDGTGRLAYMNPAAADLLGMPTRRWLGMPVVEALDSAAPGLGRVVRRSQAERRAISRFETDPAEERDFVLGVSTTLLERAEDPAPAVTAIFQDITEKLRVEHLKRRAERLEALAELSASLAHEIKNPLASIRSAVEQLAGAGVDEADRGVLGDLVVRESARVSRLLTEFLDFARVEMGEPRVVDVRALVDHAVGVIRQHPDASGRQFVVEVAADGVSVTGAEDLLHRALLNLLLNSAQWTPSGGRIAVTVDVIVSSVLAPVLGDREVVRIRVADTGPGIPVESLDHVFDPFFTGRPGGTGLGLALVHRAAEAHGGAVFVESGPGGAAGGAVFTFCVPAGPGSVPVRPPGSKDPARSRIKR